MAVRETEVTVVVRVLVTGEVNELDAADIALMAVEGNLNSATITRPDGVLVGFTEVGGAEIV